MFAKKVSIEEFEEVIKFWQSKKRQPKSNADERPLSPKELSIIGFFQSNTWLKRQIDGSKMPVLVMELSKITDLLRVMSNYSQIKIDRADDEDQCYNPMRSSIDECEDLFNKYISRRFNELGELVTSQLT